ncbi:MAG: nucleoside-diphosphate sugar epimerase/dehydratase [Pseudomonadota bacterium]
MITGPYARLRALVDRLSRRQKQAVAVATDTVALPFALWCAFALRLGEMNPEITRFWPAFVVAALLCIPVFGRLGLYRQVVRFIGNDAFFTVVQGVTIIAVVVAAVAYLIPLTGFPRSVPIIFWMLLLAYVAGTRFAVRSLFAWGAVRSQDQQRVLIFGAGERGVMLVRAARQTGRFEIAAFVDESPALQGRFIDGVFVYPPERLGDLLRERSIAQVLVPISTADDAAASQRRSDILLALEPYGVRVRWVPEMEELLSGTDPFVALRDVELKDLLGRDAVEPLPHLLAGSVSRQTVLVTGAGGSIGAELCRQIVNSEPQLLVMLDQSEYGLYAAHKEVLEIIRSRELPVAVVTVLGSVANRRLIERTCRAHGVQTLFHAAAYKHVGLVERNVIEGVRNNTFGTLYAAQAAIAAHVDNFILISTDKAVRTTSVMGATKRLAEMVLQALQETTKDTRFSMVRFGNVLGSSGSVVPLFQQQIEQGGPVTVTHRDVTRYFMTIPEAAQLVLQAASMARGGDVFLLDMGKPVRILDLAERMIRLKGYTVRSEANPDGDIAIEFTGLQPGEKLYEELLMGEAASGTDHRKIMRAEENYLPWSELSGALRALEDACEEHDLEAIKRFMDALVEGADIAEQLMDISHPADVRPLRPA